MGPIDAGQAVDDLFAMGRETSSGIRRQNKLHAHILDSWNISKGRDSSGFAATSRYIATTVDMTWEEIPPEWLRRGNGQRRGCFLPQGHFLEAATTELRRRTSATKWGRHNIII